MAAQDKVTFRQDLTEPVKIRHYEGVVFTGDDCGNLIKVALFDGGVPYSGGGTVSATAVLADGATFPLTQGSITGNMVSVPLEAGALVVSGLMGLYVKISGGGIICTVLNAIFTVQATDTGRVPTATVTTVNELVEAIRGAQDSFPADLTNLLAAVAPTFSTSTAYSAGAYVWQGGKLYRFTAAHPAGTWTGTDAVEVALGNDVADLKSAFEYTDSLVETGKESTTATHETGRAFRDNGTIGSSSSNSIVHLACVVGRKYAIKCTSEVTLGLAFGLSYSYDATLINMQKKSATELIAVCPESASGGFVIGMYPTAQADNVQFIYYDNNIEKANQNAVKAQNDVDVVKTNTASIIPANMISGASNWSGTWNNSGNWTTESGTFRGLTVKQRNGSWSGLNKEINIVSGHHYHFSAWIMAESQAGIQIAIKQTASTATVSVDNKTIASRDIAPGVWRKCNLEFDCTGSGTIHPLVQATATTTLHVCGYSLSEGYCDDKPVFRCEKTGPADFNRLTSAIVWATMYMDATVYVGSGDWDVIDEFGSSYIEGVSTSRRGLYLMNRVRVVFASDSRVLANYTGSTTNTMLWFAAFNSGAYGFTLENANIVCSKIRYCVHDERDQDADPYENRYDHCKMYLDNSSNTGTTTHQCIGGGLGLNGHIIINGGDYKSKNTLNPPSVYDVISYHNSAGTGKSRIDIDGIYIHNGTVRVNWYGTSPETDKTEAYVHGCSFTHEPRSFAETPESVLENVVLIAWNNEIRQ